MPGDETAMPRSSSEAAQPHRVSEIPPIAADASSGIYALTPSSVVSPSFLGRIPLRLGQYEILKELGRGGMGIVFLAKQPSLNRNIALKVMNTGLDTSEEELKRFRAEAQMAAQLHHPNIVQVFEVGEQEGLAFLAMEHVEGGSLHQYLGKTRLTPHEAVELLEPLARAMHYAHLKGIVHRDLKPANVLLSLVRDPASLDAAANPGSGLLEAGNTPSGRRLFGPRNSDTGPIPKITDFGLAKRFNQSSQITAMGIALGTPSYMAPEQARDDRALVGPSSDVYSLGAILYEMLTGRPPFSASTPLATLEKVVRDRPVPPRRLTPEVSPELERICLKCLEKRPQNRYLTAEALADDLRHFLVASEVTAAVQARWNLWRWIRRRPTAAIAFLGVVVFLIAMTFYKLREEAADADKFARAVQLNAKRDHDDALRDKQLLLQNEMPLIVQRGLSLCDRGDVEPGLQSLRNAQARIELGQPASFDRLIRANLTAWEKQLAPVLHTIAVADGVFALAANPESNTLASGGRNGTVRFWDAASGEEVGKPLEHPPTAKGQAVPDVKWLAWSNDGKYLASACGSLLYVWNVAERRQVGDVWDLGHDEIDSASFSGDGQFLAVATRQGDIRFRKTTDKGDKTDAIRHDRAGTPVVGALSHDGSWLATSGQNGQLRLWSKPLGLWSVAHSTTIGSWVQSLTWTGDDRRLIVGCRDGKLFVYDCETKVLYPLPAQGSSLAAAATTPDGRRFITYTRHGVVRIYDAVSRTRIGPAVVAESPVTALACPRDSATVAVGREDGTIQIHRLPIRQETGPRIYSSKEADDPAVHTVQFSKDGKWLLVATSPKAMLWESDSPDSFKKPYTFEHSQSSAAALSPNGKFVAFSGSTGPELLEVQTGQKIPLPEPLDRLQNTVQILFSPDSSRIIFIAPTPVGSKKTAVGSWVLNLDYLKVKVDELRTPPTRILAKLSAEVHQATFHPDGRWLILACSDRLVRIWDVETDTPLGWELKHPSAVISVAINREGNRILTGCSDGSLHYWNTVTGDELWTAQQGGEILSVAASADGMMLLSGSSDGTARFWDSATGLAVGPAIHHGDAVLSVGFRSDGKFAVTGSRDRTAQVWKVPE